MSNRVGFGPRFIAALIDFFVVMVIGVLFGALFGGMFGAGIGGAVGASRGSNLSAQDAEVLKQMGTLTGSFFGSFIGIIYGVILASFIPFVMEVLTGASLGKLALKLRVCSENGALALPEQIAIRNVIKFSGSFIQLLGLILAISILYSLSGIASFVVFVGCFFVFGKDKQTLHDKIAHTVICKASDVNSGIASKGANSQIISKNRRGPGRVIAPKGSLIQGPRAVKAPQLAKKESASAEGTPALVVATANLAGSPPQEMATITEKCSACGKEVVAPAHLGGKTVPCTSCKASVKLPLTVIHTLPLKLECSCGVQLQAPSSLAGKSITCPSCHQKMRLQNTVIHSKPIEVNCQECNFLVRAPANLSGKKIRCPACKQGKVQLPKVLVNPIPIHAKCFCGREIDAPGKLAGKKIRCPGCQVKLRLPQVVTATEGSSFAVVFAEPLSKPEVRRRMEQDITIELQQMAKPIAVLQASPQAPPTPQVQPHLKVPATSIPEEENETESSEQEELYYYEKKQLPSGTVISVLCGVVFLVVLFLFTRGKKEISPLFCIPVSCNVLGEIRITELQGFATISEAIQKSSRSPDFRRIQDLGFGPENLDVLTFGGNVSSADSFGGVAILKTINPVEITLLIEELSKQIKQSIPTREFKKYTFYEVFGASYVLAQPTPLLLVGGNSSLVEEVLTLLNGKGDNFTKNDKMVSLIGKEGRQELVWFATNLPSSSSNKESLLPGLEKMDSFLFGFAYKEDNFLVQSILNCTTADIATEILEGIKQILQSSLKDIGGLKEEHMDLSLVNNHQVSLKITIPYATFNSNFKSFPEKVSNYYQTYQKSQNRIRIDQFNYEKTGAIKVVLLNEGKNKIESIQYQISFNGNESIQRTKALLIASGQKLELDVTSTYQEYARTAAPADLKLKTIDFTITQVNEAFTSIGFTKTLK